MIGTEIPDIDYATIAKAMGVSGDTSRWASSTGESAD